MGQALVGQVKVWAWAALDAAIDRAWAYLDWFLMRFLVFFLCFAVGAIFWCFWDRFKRFVLSSLAYAWENTATVILAVCIVAGAYALNEYAPSRVTDLPTHVQEGVARRFWGALPPSRQLAHEPWHGDPLEEDGTVREYGEEEEAEEQPWKLQRRDLNDHRPRKTGALATRGDPHDTEPSPKPRRRDLL